MFLEVTLFLMLILLVYHNWSFGYWKRRNIYSTSQQFFFGNIKDVLFDRKSLIEMFTELYEKYKSEGLIGFYSFYRPMLLVTSPDLIKQVLVQDFNRFADNGYRIYSEADPMFGINPFCVTGIENWKRIRGIRAPLHTPGKLKEMFENIKKVAANMNKYLKETNSTPVEIMKVTSYYTIDNVTACAYGFEPSAFDDSENDFKKYATASQIFTSSSLANLSALFFPSLAKWLSLRIISKHAEHFFTSIIKSVVDYRLLSNLYRNDLIGRLIKVDQKLKEEKKPGLSDLEFAGHCITFYLNGYETSSNELAFLFLELANHQEIQNKLREEILSVGKSLDDFSYSKLNSLLYLNMVLNETLRKHPLLPVLSRECTERVQLKNSVIEKGIKVFIPVRCLHNDPEYFPDPSNFIPERFENENSIIKYTFLPFGDGPRKCLGGKFAEMQLKSAVVSVLVNFRILPSFGKETEDIAYEKNVPFVVTPKEGTKLLFQLL